MSPGYGDGPDNERVLTEGYPLGENGTGYNSGIVYNSDAGFHDGVSVNGDGVDGQIGYGDGLVDHDDGQEPTDGYDQIDADFDPPSYDEAGYDPDGYEAAIYEAASHDPGRDADGFVDLGGGPRRRRPTGQPPPPPA
ncbi:hypothetical protein MXD58_026250, partial [Frankia sp. AgKG'84/4]|nr:hypothetical protein [Frankia sp. AgKG'84/4]